MATNSHFSDFTDRRRKIPNLDPPTGIFGNHRRRLFKYEFVSLDPRLESRKSAMDISFTLGSNEEADHVKILQSCNGLLLDDIESEEFTIYEMAKGCPVWTVRRKKIPILDPLAGIFANHLRSLFEYDFVSLYPRLKSRKSAMDNSFTLGSNEETYHVKILQSCNGLLLMAFDPTKSRDYKVVQIFACLHAGLEIHVYSSKTGNLSLCKDWVSYYNFCHFPTSIYWSDAFHWLETEDMQLTLYKFHIDDHGHTIITTLEIPNGFHQGSNFLHSFCAKEGSYDPMFIQIDIPTILHLQRRLFESRGCLLLVSRDDIGFK
ncbi:hypothetical protein Tco_1448256 [Tanacetum coccineum]